VALLIIFMKITTYLGDTLIIYFDNIKIPGVSHLKACSENIFWSYYELGNLFYRKSFIYKDWRFYSYAKERQVVQSQSESIVQMLRLILDPLINMGITNYKCEILYRDENLKVYIPHPKSLLNLKNTSKIQYNNWLMDLGYNM
jgi:hypothetical protein